MKNSWLVLTAAGALIATSAVYAETATKEEGKKAASAANSASGGIEEDCKRLSHRVMLTTNSDDVKTFEEARAQFDKQLVPIKAFAEKKHFAQFGLVSIDYSINVPAEGKHIRNANSFRMRAMYKVANQEDATTLGDYLVSQKLSANVSVRNPCNAQDALGMDE